MNKYCPRCHRYLGTQESIPAGGRTVNPYIYCPTCHARVAWDDLILCLNEFELNTRTLDEH